MSAKKYLPVLWLLLIVVAVQLATSYSGKEFYLTQLTMTSYYCLLVIGLCMVMGYAGQISLGHAGFFAIGGYTSAALTTNNFASYSELTVMQLLNRYGCIITTEDMFGDTIINFHPWLAFAAAILLTTIIAFAIGIPVLKLKGHYLAMATLGFGVIIYRIVLASEALGEADGISEVPAFVLIKGLSVNGNMDDRVINYYIAWGILTIGALLLINLINSRTGRALRAIHASEEAASAMGINTARSKLYIFVISAVFAAVAGAMLTHYNGGIGPSEAGVMKSVRYVALVAIGGMANFWGALTMAATLNFLSLRGMFGSYDDAVFGAILILIMLFAPNGLFKLSPIKAIRQIINRDRR